MSIRVEHLLFAFFGYVVFLNIVSSWSMRLTFHEAFQALRHGRRSNPSRWSMVSVSIICLSLPLFVADMLLIRQI